MATLAEQLVKSLQALGVTHVFGIPGGPSIPYLEAMRSHGIEFVLVANEQSAGMMADVFGRLTGVPGVCHATFGPGATNLATGVGGALLDRSPLIAFTTEVKDADIARRVQMNIDHQALYRPITKWTTRLSGKNFGETIAQAFQITTSEMPGPVHIGLPSDIDGEVLAANSVVKTFAKNCLPLPGQSLLAETAKILEKAKKTHPGGRSYSRPARAASFHPEICQWQQYPYSLDSHGQRDRPGNASLLRWRHLSCPKRSCRACI